jgi:hypothetical protein
MAMEGFAGFGFKPSKQIAAEFQQGMQQAMTSGNKNAARMAMAQQAAFNVSGGSPEYREAKKKEKILARAQESVQSTGDELQDSIAFYRAAQKEAVEAGLPDIAFQATEKLAGLRLTQEDRERLKSQESRAVEKNQRDSEAHDQDMLEAKLNNFHATEVVLVDDQNNQVGGVDLLDPTAGDQIRDAREKGLNVTTMDKMIDLTEAEKDRQAKLADLSKRQGVAGRSTLYREYLQQMRRDNVFMIQSDRFVDTLIDPQAASTFAVGGQAEAFFERTGTQAKSLLRVMDPQADLVGDVHARLMEDERFNALDNERQAMVLNLGYALATSREGGRLTDQDVERAIISLGLQNPDPRAVAYTFGRALADKRKEVTEGLALSGVSDMDEAQEAQLLVLNNIETTLGRLEEVYDTDFSNPDITLDQFLGNAKTAAADDVDKVEEIETDSRGRTVIVVPTQQHPVQ